MINTIVTGNYKDCTVVLKEEVNPVLICKKLLGQKEIPMDKTTIRRLNHSFLENQEHDVILEWRDGTLSQAILDNTIYTAIVEKMA